jgi:choline dehydrogenase-like flavoprotein
VLNKTVGGYHPFLFTNVARSMGIEAPPDLKESYSWRVGQRFPTSRTRSVVNATGKAHEVPNLFVADRSVFVTNGSVNNTLTSLAVTTHIAESLVGMAGRGDL